VEVQSADGVRESVCCLADREVSIGKSEVCHCLKINLVSINQLKLQKQFGINKSVEITKTIWYQ